MKPDLEKKLLQLLNNKEWHNAVKLVDGHLDGSFSSDDYMLNIQLAKAYISHKDIFRARRYSEKALELSVPFSDKYFKSATLCISCYASLKLKQKKQFVEYVISNLFNSLDKRNSIRILNNSGQYFRDILDLDSAEKCLVAASLYINEESDTSLISDNLNRLAEVLVKKGENEKAINLLRKAVKQKLTIPNRAYLTRNICHLEFTIGKMAACLDALTESRKIFKVAKIEGRADVHLKFLQYCINQRLRHLDNCRDFLDDPGFTIDPIKNPVDAADIRLYRGEIAGLEGRHGDAAALFREGMDLLRDHTDMELECELYWQYGRARILAGEIEAGEKYARKAVQKSKKAGYAVNAAFAYEAISKAHHARKDYDKEEEYLKKALELDGRGFPFYRFKLLFEAAAFHGLVRKDERNYRRALGLLGEADQLAERMELGARELERLLLRSEINAGVDPFEGLQVLDEVRSELDAGEGSELFPAAYVKELRTRAAKLEKSLSRKIDKLSELDAAVLQSANEPRSLDHRSHLDLQAFLRLVLERLDGDGIVLHLESDGFEVDEYLGMTDRRYHRVKKVVAGLLTRDRGLPVLCADSGKNGKFAKLGAGRYSTLLFPLRLLDDAPSGYLYIDRVLDGRKKAHPFPRSAFRTASFFTRSIESLLDMRLSLLRTENRSLRRLLDTPDLYHGILTRSPGMRAELAKIEKVKDAMVPVLITGESGTGKELIARALHERGRRGNGPLVPVNCAAIPGPLLESELFGYRKGAFTGAEQERKGRVLSSHGGTLFLDEIGELSGELQAKLLRVLDDRKVSPLGTDRSIDVDFRLVVATNRCLEEEVKNGRFRFDLYYRVKGLTIHIPPLRDRKEDIPLLAGHFVEQMGRRDPSVAGCSFSAAAFRKMMEYDWPGNIRELKHTVETVVYFRDEETGVISADVLGFPGSSTPERATGPSIVSDRAITEIYHAVQDSGFETVIGGLEKKVLERTLEENKWVQRRAGRAVDLGESTLRAKLRKLGITREQEPASD